MSVPITNGTGSSSVAAQVVSGLNYQQVQIYGDGGSSVLGINPDHSIKVSVIGTIQASVSGTIGASIIGTVPVTGTFTIGSASVVQQGTWSVSIAGGTTVNVSGSVAAFQAGQSSTSITGTITIGAITGAASISGSVTIMGGSVMTLAAPKASWVSGVTSVMTGTAQTSVLTAAGASIKNYITHIICTNGAAAGTFVDIKDGGGNVLYSGYAAASGGGFVANPWPPIAGSANKSVDAQPRVQASIIVAMSGYTDI